MDIPIEIFMFGIGISIALALFGFIRQPQIPAMMVFGGMFIMVFAVATTSLILGFSVTTVFVPETSLGIIAQQSVVDDYNSFNSTITGEADDGGDSILIGEEIKIISLNLKSTGMVTGNAQVGVFCCNGDFPPLLVEDFGTIDVSTLTASGTWYNFTDLDSPSYLIEEGDIIGIDTTNECIGVLSSCDVGRSDTDLFDGTSSILFFDNGTDPLLDLSFILYGDVTTFNEVDSIQPFLFEFTELPKVLFALIGVVMMLCGAIMVGRN